MYPKQKAKMFYVMVLTFCMTNDMNIRKKNISG